METLETEGNHIFFMYYFTYDLMMVGESGDILTKVAPTSWNGLIKVSVSYYGITFLKIKIIVFSIFNKV